MSDRAKEAAEEINKINRERGHVLHQSARPENWDDVMPTNEMAEIIRKHFPAGDDLLRAAEQVTETWQHAQRLSDTTVPYSLHLAIEALRSAIAEEKKRRGL